MVTESVEIAVVGSLNLDVSVPVPHLPAPGETVIGGDALWSPGGKGGNQAVAAARLGRRVAMVGAVGTDAAGDQLLTHLDDDDVTFAGVRLDHVPSGLALISVAADGSGENSISVSPGANGQLSSDIVLASVEVRNAPVVLVQFEVPPHAVAAAIQTATGRVIVNPAPVFADAPAGSNRSLVAGASIVVPNEGELAQLLDQPRASSTDELVDQSRALDVEAVVVTLGADGALVVHGAEVHHVPAVVVEPVDTTAAGDTFCGALADALVGGSSLGDAVRWAVRVAAVTVTRRGAQASIPHRSDILD